MSFPAEGGVKFKLYRRSDISNDSGLRLFKTAKDLFCNKKVMLKTIVESVKMWYYNLTN